MSYLKAFWSWLVGTIFGNKFLNRYLVGLAVDELFQQARVLAAKTETDMDEKLVDTFEKFVHDNNLVEILVKRIEELHEKDQLERDELAAEMKK